MLPCSKRDVFPHELITDEKLTKIRTETSCENSLDCPQKSALVSLLIKF